MTFTRWARAVLAVATASVALAGPAPAAPGTGSADGIDAGSAGTGSAGASSSQQPAPADAGTSAADCQVSAAHPFPVIVLHGLSGSSDQFAPLRAALRNAGHCPLQLMHGNTKGTAGTGSISHSVRQLAGYVNEVKAKTGASKVNIVAHSSGALVAYYYAKLARGAVNVHKIVGLAPASHGTDAAALAGQLGSSGMSAGLSGGPAGVARAVPVIRPAIALTMTPGYADILAGSPVVGAVEQGGITQAGVGYSVLASKADTVVTPAGPASFIAEPGVENVFYEDLFPAGPRAGHPSLPMIPGVITWVVQRLV